MSWKVISLSNGKILKAGFNDEDSAYEWLDNHTELELDDCTVEEMDEEEEEEYLAAEEATDIDSTEDDDAPPLTLGGKFAEYPEEDDFKDDEMSDFDSIVDEDDLDGDSEDD